MYRWVIQKIDSGAYLSTKNRDQVLEGADFTSTTPITFGDERTALRTWVAWLTRTGHIKRRITLPGVRISYDVLTPPPQVRVVLVLMSPVNGRDLPVDVNELPLMTLLSGNKGAI